MANLRRIGAAVLLLGVGFAGGALASPRDHLGKITGASKHLDAALLSLSEAPEDFGGHKARAASLISQARTELQAAATWAETH